MTRVRPVVLSGGSGTRLWPLSVDARPKQFLDIVGGTTLFASTVDRANALPGAGEVTVVTGRGHADLVEVALGSTQARVLIEPEPRNTAPAIAAAALDGEPDDILAILPSDHLIADVDAFVEAAEVAIDLASEGRIVTFGCVPDRPEAGYGWILPGAVEGGGNVIAEFVEKPDPDRAKAMLDEGYLWNSGMFVGRASTLLEEEQTPGLVAAVRTSLDESVDGRLSDAFCDAPAISFDHSVMERTTVGTVVRLDAGWSDVGSWHAVWERAAKDENGNSVEGNAVVVDSNNSLIRATSRPVALIGIDDVVVVETADGVLVVPRQRAQDVRGIGRQVSGEESS